MIKGWQMSKHGGLANFGLGDEILDNFIVEANLMKVCGYEMVAICN